MENPCELYQRPLQSQKVSVWCAVGKCGILDHFPLKRMKLLWILIDKWVRLQTFLCQNLKFEKSTWVMYASSKTDLLLIQPEFFGHSLSVLSWESDISVWWSCVAFSFNRPVHVWFLPVGVTSRQICTKRSYILYRN